MGRSLRPNDEGLTFHALSRGNNRDAIFLDDGEFLAFLDALARAQLRYPFRLFGYCLMTNHFHLLLRPEPGVAIGRIMQSLLVSHTWRYHKRHRTLGHVWQGRFKSPPVQDDSHLWTVLRYIVANPLHAGMVADPAEYPWSSYPWHTGRRPDPLLSDLLEWTDLGDTPEARSRLAGQGAGDDDRGGSHLDPFVPGHRPPIRRCPLDTNFPGVCRCSSGRSSCSSVRAGGSS